MKKYDQVEQAFKKIKAKTVDFADLREEFLRV